MGRVSKGQAVRIWVQGQEFGSHPPDEKSAEAFVQLRHAISDKLFEAD